ncbi:MAG: carbohydrate porin [Verrucomicrobiota bacterium]|nr:carbohydrate porin [Verrucomicrobiota bacterium]
MKNPFLFLCFTLVAFQLHGKELTPVCNTTNKIPAYCSSSDLKQWWNGDYLTGEWWGARKTLADKGITFNINYTTDLAGNPTGGMSQGFTYTDNSYFGMDIDFEKLVGLHGLKLEMSGLNRDGASLSSANIGNQFTVQQIYGSQVPVFYALFLEQKLFNDKLDIKLGRFGTGDDFATSPIYWMYMNNGIDGNPQALPVNTGYYSYPAATWGARFRVDPSPEFNFMGGIYQVTQLNLVESHGLDWGINSSDGVTMIGQAAWTPEFHKQRVPSSGSDKLANDATEMNGYKGHYWVGTYFSPAQYAQFGTTETGSNAYGLYAHADQMVWKESPGTDQGLTLWSCAVLSPQESYAKLPFQVNAGAIYTGLIPTRDTDSTIFGLIYGDFSDNYARTIQSTGKGYPEYEMVFEWGYRYNMTKFIYIQPNIQWVINPGGTGHIPNALVLGAQAGVTF